VLIGHLPEPLEDVYQVEELPVDVSYDRQRGLQPQHVRLALFMPGGVHSREDASAMILRR
jgi:hypothetical protein